MTSAPENPAAGPLPGGRTDTDAALAAALEPGQLVADAARPVPRAQLSGRARAGLGLLRVFALVVSLMVIYTFVSQLHS
ncbi:MAG TPA: hypothetical protein VGD91_03100 [Trebonia sp.]